MDKADTLTESVFHQIESNKQEATICELKADLMIACNHYIQSCGMNQTKLAKHFYISRNILSDVSCGRISRCSIDRLIRLAVTFDIQVTLTCKSRL